MITIPTATHTYPNGGAIKMLANMLEERKKKGIVNLGKKCQKERYRKGHKYIPNYPCESIK